MQVRLVGEHVSFDQDAVVSVFETTIRVLGGLLAGHVLADGAMPGFPHMRVPRYDGVLLRLARDLGDRLLPAFEDAPEATGLPYAFVHLQRGVEAQVYLKYKNPRFFFFLELYLYVQSTGLPYTFVHLQRGVTAQIYFKCVWVCVCVIISTPIRANNYY
ncbi:glycoside hydrolase [Pavlovales sp. CCMP2436]|nr:glycoside hydrolase [Pavlovales sp. CCMP2436]